MCGELLAGVVKELREFDEEEEKGFLGLFRKGSGKIQSMKTKYAKAEVNVNQICKVLESHQVRLMKDVAVLDKMYELNLTYYKELSMYILAGKKIHDLELTRTISMQTAPQIRLIQGNDTLMVEKIQSTVVNTIPLWKSQMVLTLGVEHSAQAAAAQREVTDMTNELLRKNADKLKMAVTETARESERGIVEIETLKHTNESLISTLDEVMQIQREGRQKRAEAEQEMRRLERELKGKLLQIQA